MKKAIKSVMENGLWMICKPSYIVLGMRNLNLDDYSLVDKWVETRMGRFYLRNLFKIGRL